MDWDWFYVETDYKKPNPTKFSANAVIGINLGTEWYYLVYFLSG